MRRLVRLFGALGGATLLLGAATLPAPSAAPRSPSLDAAADALGMSAPRGARWMVPEAEPIRVHIARGSKSAGWTPRHQQLARAAFSSWAGTGIPVRFSYVASPESADVVVRWRPQLQGKVVGLTRRWTTAGIVDRGVITLALRDRKGRPLSQRMVKGAAIHEVGHLLGLDHTRDRSSVMYPKIGTSRLSERDAGVIRWLYAH